MIQALGACIDAVIKSGMNYISFDSKSILIGKVKNWLKSIKDRVQPQSQWKPSEEQIQALEWQVVNTNESSWQGKASKELLEQLKQL
jgi:hypothetical protein